MSSKVGVIIRYTGFIDASTFKYVDDLGFLTDVIEEASVFPTQETAIDATKYLMLNIDYVEYLPIACDIMDDTSEELYFI